MLTYRKADKQGLAAHGTTPFRAVTVRDIRAADRLGMKRLERLLFAASGAVPGHMRHPGDLLGAARTCSD